MYLILFTVALLASHLISYYVWMKRLRSVYVQARLVMVSYERKLEVEKQINLTMKNKIESLQSTIEKMRNKKC